MRRCFGVFAYFVLTMLLISGCFGTGSGADLPDGPQLLKKAAEAMATVKSAAFALETEGEPPIPIRGAEGRLNTAGDGDGTVRVEVLGNLQELEFVLVGDTVYLKGPTGGYQTMPRTDLARFYDPSALLSAETGVPALLAAATEAVTEARERVEGADAYRITATLPQQALAPIVPGVTEAVEGTLWIDAASSRLLRASLPLGDGEDAGTVTVTVRDYDVPVQVTAPK